jgi:hypothetical protein
MTSSIPSAWLDLFCDALHAGPLFRQRLDEALRPAFVAQIGSPPVGYTLVPPPGGEADVVYRADGAAEVETDLVAPDALGWPVTVCWRVDSVAHPLPSDPGVEAAAAAGSLHAWWQSGPAPAQPFPVPPPATLHPDPARLPFALEARPHTWPDLWLELEFVPGTDAQRVLPGLISRLQGMQKRWNATGSGLIHQVGSQAAVLEPDVAVVNVDFGSASPSALAAALDALADASLDLRRVIVRSSLRDVL